MYNECRHIFTSGKKCQSPALLEQDFCYFHRSYRTRKAADPYDPYGPASISIHNLPQLEDADAIQLAISDVVLALAANRIDPRRARILLYGLQIASQNNRHRSAESKQPTVREVHEQEDGTLVGPSQQSPDPEDIPKVEEQSIDKLLLQAMREQMEREDEAQRQAKEAAESERKGINIQAVAERKPQNRMQNRVPHSLRSKEWESTKACSRAYRKLEWFSFRCGFIGRSTGLQAR